MFNVEHFEKNLFELTTSRQFLIGYSGGLDSHVLLHAFFCLRQLHPEVAIRAIHVHHNLSPHADHWATHCQKNCSDWNIDFQVKKIDLTELNGESLEAVARQKRYAVFAENLLDGECLVTAHTQTDQAETVLLRLLRGSGVRGLGAMVTKKRLGESFLLRPLLSFTREGLQQYALNKQLSWIEDESNQDIRFDRNYLRHHLFPLFKKRWPSVIKRFSQSASMAGEAQDLLKEFADYDLQNIFSAAKNGLNAVKLRELSLARQRNVLRRWLELQNILPPSLKQMQQIQNELLPSRQDAMACVSWADVKIKIYQGYLYLLKAYVSGEAAVIIPWNLKDTIRLPFNADFLKTEFHPSVGLHLRYLNSAEITIRFRQGGEKCQPLGRKEKHSLKKLFQEWQVPPWQRERVPLIYYQEQIIAVVGYCICEGHASSAEEQGIQIVRDS